MLSPREEERLRILKLVIGQVLDSSRFTAARQVLETATDEQVQRILSILAEQITKGTLLLAFAFLIE